MNIQEDIKIYALENNIPLLGFSDLAPAMDYLCTTGGEEMKQYPYCITLGMVLPQPIMKNIKEEYDHMAVLQYLYAYQAANSVLGNAAFSIANNLESEGYLALPIGPAVFDRKKLTTNYSHKIGARLSGLGWIGKSGMLITEEYGSRVRFASVLTNAPMETYKGEPMKSKCGNCTACVDACPVKAYKNREFDPAEPIEMRFDTAACNAHLRWMEDNGMIDLCGLCITACPHSKKK